MKPWLMLDQIVFRFHILEFDERDTSRECDWNVQYLESAVPLQ